MHCYDDEFDDFIDCKTNDFNSDLNKKLWDWIYITFSNELYPGRDITLEEHYEHMQNQSTRNYYIFIGLAKGCKCGSCRGGVGIVIINKDREADIYRTEYAKNNIYLSQYYLDEMQAFADNTFFIE